MIVVLPFCHHDAEQARTLLRWMRELGTYPSHELILQASITAAAGGQANEMLLEAEGLFGIVNIRTCDISDERGWPYSCNAAWVDALKCIKNRISHPWRYKDLGQPPKPDLADNHPYRKEWKAKAEEAMHSFNRPWLWLEPDAVPLVAGWLDKIETEYKLVNERKNNPKYLMGGEVKKPQHRMSGVAVYPPQVAQFTRGIPMLGNNKAPWDQVLAKDFMPHVHFTPLIQNIWNQVVGDPTSIPTFPTQESLAMLDPQAVLFHRVKDGTLIERLREKRGVFSMAQTDYCGPDLGIPVPSDSDALKSRIAELEAQLRSKEQLAPALEMATPKRKMSPEHKAKIQVALAKARAAKKAKLTGVL